MRMVRALGLLTLLAALAFPLRAEEAPLASRFPDGATVYVELNGLAGRVDHLLASPLGRSVREHPAVKQFLASPQGMQLFFAQGMLQGMTGLDFAGALKAIASREVGLALYGGPAHAVVMARVDAAVVERLLAAAEMALKGARTTVLPAADGLPALWQFGPAYVCLDGDLLTVTPDQLLATSIRGRAAKGFAAGDLYQTSRPLVDAGALLFACGDLKPYAAALAAGGLPGDLGQAIIAGAFSHLLPAAGWAALGLDLRAEEDGVALEAKGFLPRPPEGDEGVAAAYGGTLAELPFALPERTVGVLRMRRDLGSLWTNREALIAQRGIPSLIEFETNFGNLTSGMSWVEEFLPALGGEMILIGTRRPYAPDEQAPAVRYPEGALLVPFKGNESVRLRLEVAFHSTVGIINLQTAQMKGMPLMPSVDLYKGVKIQFARYLPPSGAEMEMQKGLPARYNFAPAMAILGDHLAIASSDRILRELIDGLGRPTPVEPGVNAGFWLRADESRALLEENRESLVAQRMLEKSDTRAAAEQAVDLGLGLARYLRAFEFKVVESRSTLSVSLKVGLGPRGGEEGAR